MTTLTPAHITLPPSDLQDWQKSAIRDVLVHQYRLYGLSVETYKQWRALGYTGMVLIDLLRSQRTVEEITPYVQAMRDTGLPLISEHVVSDLNGYLSSEVSAADAVAYMRAGLTEPSRIGDVAFNGCTPQVVQRWIAAETGRSGQSFWWAYEELICQPDSHDPIEAPERAVLHAVLATGTTPTPEDLLAWTATGLPVPRIALLAAAGVTPGEALTPVIAAADNITLQTMGALRRRGDTL